MGTTIPVEITVFEDRSFTFVTKTPPAAVLIRQAIDIEKGSGEPHREKVGKITQAQLRADRREEAADLNAHDVDAGGEDHRRHRPLDGRGGGRVMAKHGKTLPRGAREGRPRARVRARRGDRARQGDSSARSSTSPSRCTSAPGLNVRHADEQLRGTIALPNGLGKDVNDRRLRQGRQGARGRGGRRRRRRAPRTSPSASRRASPTSTSRSRRPT